MAVICGMDTEIENIMKAEKRLPASMRLPAPRGLHRLWRRFMALCVFALALLGAGGTAHAACSANFEDGYLNEYFFGTGTNFLEVFVPNNTLTTSTEWSTWTIRVYTGAGTYTTYPMSGATACDFGSKTYLTYDVPAGLPGTGGAVNAVLYDGSGNEIDYLKFDNSSPVPIYTTAQCTYGAGHDHDLVVSSYGNKDVARFPDGTGTWSISSLTGANTTYTKCSSNDPAIAKVVSASSIPVASSASFTITVANASNKSIDNVTVTDLLPAGLTYESHTASVGSYNSGTGVWTIGTMAKNATATLTINFHGNTVGSYTNTATLSYTGITYSASDSAIANIVPVVDHIRIEHGGSGLTCTPSSITVKACSDAACTTLYTGGVTGNLTWAGAPGGSVAFATGGTGQTTVNLSVLTPQTVTLGANSVSPAPSGTSPQCYVGATANCSHTFADTGFIFSAIPTQTAGVTSGSLSIQAVRKADNSAACTGLFTGNVAIGMASQCINPTTCAGKQVTINSTAIANNPASGIASYTPVTLNFGANSTATFALNYPDVGAMSLSARYLLGGSSYMTGTSNTFVVKPYGFALSGIKRTADSFANPAAADATGTAFIKAGASFSATVTALAYNAAGNTTTPNYGREIIPEGVLLTPNLVAGLGLTNNPALTNGTIAGTEFGSGGAVNTDANGVATVTNLAWNEVGIITLAPSIADADYLGAGDTTGAASGNVGRFYPDHFALSAGTITNRTDISPACSPASTFTYMGEPFQAGFTLTAKGPAPGNVTLQNYATSGIAANNFAKLATGAPAPAGFGLAFLDGTTNLTARMDSSIGISGSWTAGVLNATATLGLTRDTAPDGPYNALKVGIAPLDSDGVTLNAFDMDATAPAGNDHAEVAQTQIRFGRLRLNNAHGSELLNLPIPISVQYWNGTQFATNAEDSCTALTSANFSLTKSPPALATSLDPVSIVFTSGVGSLKLTKPSATGSVDLCVDLGSDPVGGVTCSAAASAGKSYLQGKWAPGTNWDNDPTARATFGVYKNSNEFIYLREMY